MVFDMKIPINHHLAEDDLLLGISSTVLHNIMTNIISTWLCEGSSSDEPIIKVGNRPIVG